MKTPETILNTLTGAPQFRTLRQHQCYRRFLAALPPRFQEAIGFVYLRERTLHIALRHPGYKMELSYQTSLFLTMLETLASTDEACSHLKADTVVLFNSTFTTRPTEAAYLPSVPHYYELSEGTFEDHSSDPDLHAQFERTRQLIRANRNHDA